jgi:hypothetical protein
MRIAGFDWDNGNWPKCGKHGVAQAEIEAVLSGSPAILPDPAHSSAEQRFLAIGQIPSGRHLLVAFTLRTQGAHWLIRPVSARFMHAKEVRHYARQAQDDPGADE